MQLIHSQSKFNSRAHNIVLACDALSSPANVGGLFRIADAFGIEKIVFGTTNVDLNSNRLKRTARSTQNWVPIENSVDLAIFLPKFRDKGYQIIALEITTDSTIIYDIDFSENKNIVLVIGEENSGINAHILTLCDQQVHINMFGKNSSMNVTQAAAIALYEITKQINN